MKFIEGFLACSWLNLLGTDPVAAAANLKSWIPMAPEAACQIMVVMAFIAIPAWFGAKGIGAVVHRLRHTTR